MNRKIVAASTFALIAIFGATSQSASAKASPKSADKELLGNAAGIPHADASQMGDGAPLIDKWLKASQSYEGYQFDYRMTVYKPDGTVTDTGHLWFKKPRLLKISQSGGPHKGAVAVLGSDGKVKAHAGGSLRFFSVSLSPDSGYLKSSNGWPMVDSDFISLAEAVKSYIKEGDQPKSSESPVTVENRKVNIFELYKGKGSNPVIFKRALFDPETNLPVEWWDYKDGKLWAHSNWSNFQAGAPSDQTFTLKGEK